MNKDNLIDVLGQVDDDLYQAADALRQQPVKKKNKVIWIRWAAMAACLCVVVAAGAFVLLPKVGGFSMTATDSVMAMAEVPTKENASEGRIALEEDYAETSVDNAAAEPAIAPQANEAVDEVDGSTNDVTTFSASASSESPSAANEAAGLTIEIITADRDEVLNFTDVEKVEAILTWISGSDALTADEFSAQVGSITDRSNWPDAVTIITVTSDDGPIKPEVWYVPVELPEAFR